MIALKLIKENYLSSFVNQQHDTQQLIPSAMILDHYLLSMIIEALLANGMRDITELNIVAQQHMPAIKRIFIESGLDQEPISDSLYEQLLEMTTDYFSLVLPLEDRSATSA